MLLLVVSSTAYAHKVSIYAYAEDGMIHAEGYFA
ncbi:MAG TPA: carboxypeptidase regulatory-like domain-containing protein, partial [Nitrospirae bacterium]|nr:carboxypeptidase regulatory-like domain-containing protein [Nitrospirota bacterium]